MALTSAPLNANEPMVDEKRHPTKTFLQWVTSFTARVDTSPSRTKTVDLAAQGAAIGTTAIGSPSATGLYRVSVYQRITTVAGVSSSLTTTIAWTESGVACSQAGAALTGNLTTTTGSFTLLIRADAATPISYSTAYASNAAGVMKYRISITLESVSA